MRNDPLEINDSSEESESEGSRVDYAIGGAIPELIPAGEVEKVDPKVIVERTKKKLRKQGALLEAPGQSEDAPGHNKPAGSKAAAPAAKTEVKPPAATDTNKEASPTP